MQTQTIQRQYDDIIAPHYDLDPQTVTGRTLDRAADQIRLQVHPGRGTPLRVLDLGIGTGLFLARLEALSGARRLEPFGLDLSAKMIDCARRRIPNLVAAVDDAANVDEHFLGQRFDLVCTHFITGFVPMDQLAPRIWSRLDEGGYWSFVGGTKAGYPALQARANSRLFRCLSRGRPLAVDDLACNPADRDEVVRTLENNGFAIRACDTFEPELVFRNFDEFMDFAYRGGWLTPFIEALGLHRSGAPMRSLLNLFFFPITDHHSIEIVLAQKVQS